MGSFQRICRLLKDTGFYKLRGNSLVEAEMKAYASVLEELSAQLERILEYCFLDSPDNLRLSYFEDLFGLAIDPQDDEQTKLDKIQQMKKRLQVRNTDFSKAAVTEQLRMGGFTADLTEDPDSREVQVVITQDRGYCSTKADKEMWIRNAMPCHATPKIIEKI